jgi:hypothetical protein
VRRFRYKTYIGAKFSKRYLILELTLDYSTQQIQQEVKIYQHPPNIKVSEVGIYDINKNLVCIGN